MFFHLERVLELHLAHLLLALTLLSEKEAIIPLQLQVQSPLFFLKFAFLDSWSPLLDYFFRIIHFRPSDFFV